MCCTGQTWTRANTETRLSTTLTSLPWSVSHSKSLHTEKILTCGQPGLWSTKVWVLLRYHLSVDVLAQLQLSYYKLRWPTAQNRHEHLLLSGRLHTGYIRFLRPSQPRRQIGHGEHPLVAIFDITLQTATLQTLLQASVFFRCTSRMPHWLVVLLWEQLERWCWLRLALWSWDSSLELFQYWDTNTSRLVAHISLTHN